MDCNQSKPVRQCCCYPYSFAEIQQKAQMYHWQTVEEIGEALGCGKGCGMCRPYLTQMLQTGETAFAVIEASEQEIDDASLNRNRPLQCGRANVRTGSETEIREG